MDKDIGLWDFRIIENDPLDRCGLFRKRYYCPACGVWQSYGATKFCPDCGYNMYPDAGVKSRTYDIGFITDGLGDGFHIEDETEFDLVEAPFEDMTEELLDLWRVFCDENGYHNAQITYVREVKAA